MGSVKRFEISVDADGVMFLPADVCTRMGLENGGKLSLTEGEFGLKLTNLPENKTSTDPIQENLYSKTNHYRARTYRNEARGGGLEESETRSKLI